MARLRPGVSIEQANADVARMIAIELDKFPPPNGLSRKMMDDARLGPNVRLLKDDVLGDIGRSLWVVMATIGIVLLIACANVANLLLVRTEGRAQELAVRAALGAGRGRVARELLVESLLLALTGGVLGVGFASAAVKLILHISPARLPRFDQISVDSMALLFTLGVSVRDQSVRSADVCRGGGGPAGDSGRGQLPAGAAGDSCGSDGSIAGGVSLWRETRKQGLEGYPAPV